jgi:FkbM family methyltransferase
MKIDLNDDGLSQDLFINKIREYPNVEYFSEFIKKYSKDINVICDIGANIGYYVAFENAILQKTSKKDVQILAIEPVAETAKMLKENMDLNKVKGGRSIQAAVGDKDTKINILVPEAKNLSQIEGINVGNRLLTNANKYLVNMYTLPTLFEKYKLEKNNVLFRWDVEGYEYNIIKGNKDFFKKMKRAFIIMEFHPFYLKKRKTIEFLTMVKDIGFKLDMVVSCEPIYFLRTPQVLRNLLKKSWLSQYNGKNLGLIQEYRTIDDLKKDFKDEKSALYNYANLHFYFRK